MVQADRRPLCDTLRRNAAVKQRKMKEQQTRRYPDRHLVTAMKTTEPARRSSDSHKFAEFMGHNRIVSLRQDRARKRQGAVARSFDDIDAQGRKHRPGAHAFKELDQRKACLRVDGNKLVNIDPQDDLRAVAQQLPGKTGLPSRDEVVPQGPCMGHIGYDMQVHPGKITSGRPIVAVQHDMQVLSTKDRSVMPHPEV